MNDRSNHVDINTAEIDRLTSISGIGPELAQRIIASRPFASLEDLRRVPGIGPVLLEQLKPYLTLTQAEASPEEELSFESSAAPVVEGADVQAEAPVEEMEGQGQAVLSEADAAAHEIQAAHPQPEPELTGVAVPAPEAEAVVRVEAAPEAEPVSERELPPEAEPVRQPSEAQAGEPVEGARPGPAAAPVAAPAAKAERQPAYITRGGAFWLVFTSALFAFVLAVALSLGLLSLLNGGLYYASQVRVASLEGRLGALNSQADTLSQSVDGLRTRLDNLEGLAGRVTTIENDAQQLRSDVDQASAQVSQLNDQVGGLQTDVQDLQASAGRFQNFLDGLRQLLSSLAAPAK